MATSSYDAGRMDASEYDVTGGGWITFAAILLGLAGTFNVLEGILAIANSRVYTAHQTFVFSNLNTWGWIVLVRNRGRQRQRDRAAVLRPCVSDLVADAFLGGHPDHLRTRCLRRTQAARRLRRARPVLED